MLRSNACTETELLGRSATALMIRATDLLASSPNALLSTRSHVRLHLVLK